MQKISIEISSPNFYSAYYWKAFVIPGGCGSLEVMVMSSWLECRELVLLPLKTCRVDEAIPPADVVGKRGASSGVLLVT
ncbi:hypothetical protein TNCV_4403101 [Trichonephila clavipes]|uniref:Uncharacterized protein n=1 Tax=Trichonephila clavipes TaxID=2585209 RepID=A0A8X6SEP7_TRICX|nr:hypothetical protein TNCV_4403101 [Trichonephila clavipes]